MLLVALSRRMCCSRVCSVSRIRGRTVGVDGDADEAARQLAGMLCVHDQIPGVRSAESHWNTEALSVAERHVGADLTGRRDQGQREQVGADDHERAASCASRIQR